VKRPDVRAGMVLGLLFFFSMTGCFPSLNDGGDGRADDSTQEGIESPPADPPPTDQPGADPPDDSDERMGDGSVVPDPETAALRRLEADSKTKPMIRWQDGIPCCIGVSVPIPAELPDDPPAEAWARA